MVTRPVYLDLFEDDAGDILVRSAALDLSRDGALQQCRQNARRFIGGMRRGGVSG